MHEPVKHRTARFLRAALSGTILLQGLFASWTAAPLYASDTMVLGVTAASSKPPAAITDLAASANLAVEGQISLTWTAPQGNVGGTPIPNWPVAAYVIHYATFSVDSMGGDTNAWWNASSTSTVLLQGPSFIPKSPGQMEAYALSGLVPGAHYYFGIESISQGGITSPIDVLSATPGQQANAISTKFANDNGTPKRPNGLSSSASGGQFTLNWHAGTQDTNGNSITIDHYLVSRYDAIGSTPTQTNSVTVPTYTDTIGGGTYFYRIFAVSNNGNTSAASDYMDTSTEQNRYAIAPDDVNTRVVVPASLSDELNSEHDVFGQDLEIRLTRRQQDEIDVTMRSYKVGVYNTVTSQEVPFFAFSESGMLVQLGLGSSLGAGKLTPSQTQTLSAAAGTGSAGSIAQIVSVYWFNGSTYVRISDPILTSNQALSVAVRNVGIYQIRATQLTTTFQLTQGSPYPRVITPRDPSQNNRVFWFFDNPSGDPVTGTIYDIRGAKVRDLVMNSQSPTANSLVWDGRDNNGSVVPTGVYLYKVSSGKENQTGTVVVAR